MLKLTLPRPHPAQYQVLREHRRFNVLCCGRRWGKTTIAIDRLLRPALKGKPVAWFAPTYRSLKDAWGVLVEKLEPATERRNESDHWLKLYGGAVVECWSLDNPDAGRGRAYACIVLDEAALVADLEKAWQQSMRPMLADYQGAAWFLSTPKGIANYFHTLYQMGQDPSKTDWVSWRMPTTANPHIKPAEIESAHADLTDLAFAQEYEAQFVTWAGSVFRRITDAIRPIKRTGAAMIGVDWGRTGDFTVFTALSREGAVLETDRFRGIEYAIQRDRLGAFWKRLGARAWIIAETNAMGMPIVEQLQRDGLPVIGFNTTSASKSAAIQALALAFERGSISIPNDPVLIGELQAYEGKPGPSGMMKYSAPAGLHDDCVMSLAMAWAGLVAPQERRMFLDPQTGATGAEYRPYQISPI